MAVSHPNSVAGAALMLCGACNTDGAAAHAADLAWVCATCATALCNDCRARHPGQHAVCCTTPTLWDAAARDIVLARAALPCYGDIAVLRKPCAAKRNCRGASVSSGTEADIDVVVGRLCGRIKGHTLPLPPLLRPEEGAAPRDAAVRAAWQRIVARAPAVTDGDITALQLPRFVHFPAVQSNVIVDVMGPDADVGFEGERASIVVCLACAYHIIHDGTNADPLSTGEAWFTRMPRLPDAAAVLTDEQLRDPEMPVDHHRWCDCCGALVVSMKLYHSFGGSDFDVCETCAGAWLPRLLTERELGAERHMAFAVLGNCLAPTVSFPAVAGTAATLALGKVADTPAGGDDDATTRATRSSWLEWRDQVQTSLVRAARWLTPVPDTGILTNPDGRHGHTRLVAVYFDTSRGCHVVAETHRCARPIAAEDGLPRPTLEALEAIGVYRVVVHAVSAASFVTLVTDYHQGGSMLHAVRRVAAARLDGGAGAAEFPPELVAAFVRSLVEKVTGFHARHRMVIGALSAEDCVLGDGAAVHLRPLALAAFRAVLRGDEPTSTGTTLLAGGEDADAVASSGAAFERGVQCDLFDVGAVVHRFVTGRAVGEDHMPTLAQARGASVSDQAWLRRILWRPFMDAETAFGFGHGLPQLLWALLGGGVPGRVEAAQAFATRGV